MTIYPSKSSRCKPIWLVDYALLGKQKRKAFPRNPEVAQADDAGYKLAEKFSVAQTKKIFNEGPSLAKLENSERIALFGFYEKIRSLDLTIAQAEAIVIASTLTPKATLLVPAVVVECLNSKRARLGVGMSKRYVKQLGHVLNWFAYTFAHTPIDRVTATEIETWIQSGNYSSASRRSRLSDIRTLFAFAIKRKYLKENPCLQIEPIIVQRKTPGILSPRQAAKLLRVAYNRDRSLCAWLAISMFCGVRDEELQRLTAKNLIIEKKMVHIAAEDAKTKNARNVTIPENALEWIAIGGTKDFPPKNLKRRFERLRRQAGLFKHWPNRAMRHSSVTYLYALTEDADRVAKEHGHGVRVMLSAYNATKTQSGLLVTKELAQEYFAIKPPCHLRILEHVA